MLRPQQDFTKDVQAHRHSHIPTQMSHAYEPMEVHNLKYYLFGGMLGMEPGALDMQGKLSTSELHHQALSYL